MSGCSSRYARALFMTGREEGGGREFHYGALLAAFVKSLAETPSSRSFLAGAQANKTSKKLFLEQVFTDAEDRRFLSFLKVLVDKNRMDIIDFIGLDYRRLELDARRILEAVIESAFPLDEKTLESVREAFRKRTGAREIRSTVRIVPELVGGIRVSIGGAVYDGTIRSELERLRGQIKK